MFRFVGEGYEVGEVGQILVSYHTKREVYTNVQTLFYHPNVYVTPCNYSDDNFA